MSRSHRLFDLLQSLRRHRGVVSGAILARETGVSLRTIRRDMVTLQAMGADIDAEAGLGYALRPGFLLPPLSFTEEELHALAIGAEWVSRQTDEALSFAVRNALAKIEGVLAPHERSALDGSSFYIEPARDAAPAGLGLAEYRRALREQRKIRVLWQGEDGKPSSRIVWPIMLGFAGKKRSFAAWCETRGAYDLFTAEKIVAAEILADRYPRSRRVMVAEWRAIAAEHCNATAKD